MTRGNRETVRKAIIDMSDTFRHNANSIWNSIYNLKLLQTNPKFTASNSTAWFKFAASTTVVDDTTVE